ncbi:MAG: hypothetical protein COC24_011995 [Alphaproteobacteria bacterium]|nr:hypothetical protein [Alphaproteobacteria bacterium]
MKDSYSLIYQFINSFGRRNFDEMESCLAENFLCDGGFICISGREKFVKSQKRLDSNFIISVSNLQFNHQTQMFEFELIYHIYFHTRQRITLEAATKIYVKDELIYKIEINYKHPEYAQEILSQMIIR